jgi:hypothetical protein
MGKIANDSKWLDRPEPGSIPAAATKDIGKEIVKRVTPASVAAYRTTSKRLPASRFVDMFNAIAALVYSLIESVRLSGVEPRASGG